MPKLVLLWISATFLAGIITAGVASITTNWSWGFILVALLFFFYCLNKKKKFSGNILFLSLLLAAFYCGALRYQSFVEKTMVGFDENITPGETITIQGIVAEPTQPSTQYGETILELHRYMDPNGNWQPAEGKVVIRLPELFDFQVHTSLTLQGVMESSVKADAKPYTSWLKRNGVDYRMFSGTCSYSGNFPFRSNNHRSNASWNLSFCSSRVFFLPVHTSYVRGKFLKTCKIWFSLYRE